MTLDPLLLTDFLGNLGAPEWAVIGASGIFILWHFRSALLVASQVATALKVIAIVTVLALVASTGLVPGFDIIVKVETLGSWGVERVTDIWRSLEGFVR